MLGKLIKYDLENINKLLIIFYIITLIFAVLTRIFLSIENSFIFDIIGKICSGTTIALMINSIINNIIRLWVRFKSNLYGDESYLTHTLPVTKNQIYLSKFITSFITLFVSTLVIILTLFIAYYSKENLDFLIKGLLDPIAKIYDSSAIVIILLFIFICFLELFNILQAGYFGMICGHKMNSNKLLLSVAFGFIGYMVLQFILILILFVFAIFNKDIMNLFHTTGAVGIDMIKTVIWYGIIGYSVLIIIGFFVNIKLFNKGVNVD